MKLSDSTVQALTRRLLADEAGERQDLEAVADVAERTMDKLRLHLSKLLGPDGFLILLRRALTLAQAEFPWLNDVQTQPDGTIQGIAAAASAVRAEGSTADAAAFEGITAVPAHFLGLLEVFIGEDLTLRLLHGVWPGVAIVPPAQEMELSDDARGAKETIR